MTTYRNKTERGFTLVEAMVSFLILTFGLVALMQLFAAAILSNAVARSNTFATQAAQQVTEDLKTQYATWLEGTRLGKKAPGDPFPLTGSVSVNVEDPNGAVAVNQTKPTRVTVQAVYLNQFNVAWAATRDEQARNVYRVDITARPYQTQASNQPVKLTTYFAP